MESFGLGEFRASRMNQTMRTEAWTVSSGKTMEGIPDLAIKLTIRCCQRCLWIPFNFLVWSSARELMLVTPTVMVGGSRRQVFKRDPLRMTRMMMTPRVDGA